MSPEFLLVGESFFYGWLFAAGFVGLMALIAFANLWQMQSQGLSIDEIEADIDRIKAQTGKNRIAALLQLKEEGKYAQEQFERLSVIKTSSAGTLKATKIVCGVLTSVSLSLLGLGYLTLPDRSPRTPENAARALLSGIEQTDSDSLTLKLPEEGFAFKRVGTFRQRIDGNPSTLSAWLLLPVQQAPEADTNDDGTLTLPELADYLRQHHDKDGNGLLSRQQDRNECLRVYNAFFSQKPESEGFKKGRYREPATFDYRPLEGIRTDKARKRAYFQFADEKAEEE